MIEIISESLLFPLDGGFNVIPLKTVSWQNFSLAIRIQSAIESPGNQRNYAKLSVKVLLPCTWTQIRQTA